MDGVVAQLAERLVRNEKVAGSIPVGSTILRSEQRRRFRAKDGVLHSLGEGGLWSDVPSYGWQAIPGNFG